MIVNVKLWGKDVGSLFWDSDKEVASFQYEPKFLRLGLDISPIVMPLKNGPEVVYEFLQNRTPCFNGLPGLIADSLPDKFGTQLINEWFAARGLSTASITPLERLCYVGKRAMGALEFKPDTRDPVLDESSLLKIDELTCLADEVFRNREHFQEKLLQAGKPILDILKIGTSAGGAKPKAIIAYNESTGEVRSGQVKAPNGFTYWILKFDGTVYSEHDKVSSNPQGIGNIEYAYYKMALDCGIRMSECRLLSEGNYHHFMTKRFDRSDNGEKIHMQTLAGLAHYDRDTRHSYEEAFTVMRKMRLPYPQMEEFYRRMVFNVVARNHDDHTKNHSFLMDSSGNWKLSPAYDLCYSYSPSGRWTREHQMSLCQKRDNFTFDDLVGVGQLMDINSPKEIINQIVDVVSRWKEYAQACGVKENHSIQIEKELLLLQSAQNIFFSGFGM